MFKTNAFYYDAYYDCYLCENDQQLVYRTTTREGRREYVSDPKICETYPFLERCTKSQTMQKVIHRHVWQDAIDEVEHLRHTPVNRQLYARRKETIGGRERKAWHALDSLPRVKKSDDAGNAHFCCPEPQKIGQLVMGFQSES
nr:transposase [Exiguobacterium oxidotolerans]